MKNKHTYLSIKMKHILCTTLILLLTNFNFTKSDCIPRDFGNDGTVCVCTNENCDELGPFNPPKPGQYIVYVSNKDGLRFNVTYGNFSQEILKKKIITINPDKQYQSINGWGGAFTDATGININSLTGKARDRLLESYFDKTKGIEYNLCRVPIGGTDFSTRPYTYLDEKDETLNKFNLTEEDHKYKIPLIKEALRLNDNLKLFGTAWTAPAWMKTNNALAGVGYLLDKYYQQWADYYMKFFQHYENEGIEFWGLTTGNEPVNGILPVTKINSMGWIPQSQSLWIRKHLGPTLKQSKYNQTKTMALDDQRFFLPWWPMLLFKNNETRSLIDGIAVHWYWDEFLPASLLTRTHNLYPEKFILATEACVGDKFWQKSVELGSWKRGEMYLKDIIEDVNNWSTGWIDWNMALNLEGGPTYIDNFVDSPIIINASAQEFYKQPMFYAIGHVSKFVPREAKRIDYQYEGGGNMHVAAFLRPDNGIVVIVQNEDDENAQLTIVDKTRGTLDMDVTKRSFNTFIYF